MFPQTGERRDEHITNCSQNSVLSSAYGHMSQHVQGWKGEPVPAVASWFGFGHRPVPQRLPDRLLPQLASPSFDIFLQWCR